MFGNMADMFGKVNEMRRMMDEAKEKINETKVYSEAGGGVIKIEATAGKRILSIKIDPELFSDPEMIEDLLVTAVNKAMDQAEEVSHREMSKVSGQLLPGVDLSSLGF